MITSLIELLELPNFGHMTTSTTQFESHDKVLMVTSESKIMTSESLFQIFADVIKIVTMFIKNIFKGSKKIRNYVLKCYLCLYLMI